MTHYRTIHVSLWPFANDPGRVPQLAYDAVTCQPYEGVDQITLQTPLAELRERLGREPDPRFLRAVDAIAFRAQPHGGDVEAHPVGGVEDPNGGQGARGWAVAFKGWVLSAEAFTGLPREEAPPSWARDGLLKTCQHGRDAPEGDTPLSMAYGEIRREALKIEYNSAKHHLVAHHTAWLVSATLGLPFEANDDGVRAATELCGPDDLGNVCQPAVDCARMILRPVEHILTGLDDRRLGFDAGKWEPRENRWAARDEILLRTLEGAMRVKARAVERDSGIGLGL